MNRCPNGHFTSAADYCDICGAPVDGGAAGAAGAATETQAASTVTPAGPATEPCPGCGTPHTPDALFCETCGYDFTTGTMPRPLDPPDQAEAAEAPGAPEAPEVPAALPDLPAPTPVARWVVEVWTDPDWYAESQGPDPLPSSGPPRTVVLTGRSALVGRPSTSRNIHPDVDCADDSGVSRRHAQLTTDGTRFWVEDLESANGTFVAPSGGPLPKDPVPVGAKHELDPDDRVYVGAWTRLVVRPALQDEAEDEQA